MNIHILLYLISYTGNVDLALKNQIKFMNLRRTLLYETKAYIKTLLNIL